MGAFFKIQKPNSLIQDTRSLFYADDAYLKRFFLNDVFFSNNGWQIICIKIYLNTFLHVTLSLDVDGIKLRMRIKIAITFFRAVRLCRDSRPPCDK